MINSYEKVYSIKPTSDGDHVSLLVTHNRGDFCGVRGYEFRVRPFFDDGRLGRCYHVRLGGTNYPRIDYPCARQSKRRYEEAKESAFAYILSDAGVLALKECGIELLELVGEREYDRYA